MFTKVLSAPIPSLCPTASMIRRFAWCGTNRSTSAGVSRSRASTSRETSSIDRMAILNVSFPFILIRFSRPLTVSIVVGRSVPPAGIVMKSAISPSE